MNDVYEYPASEYIDLRSIISFSMFDFRQWQTHEFSVLTPQLERLGYTDIFWMPGETDDFGPLIRVCQATNPEGKIIFFFYG